MSVPNPSVAAAPASPFAQAAPAMAANGYHVIPIEPGTKRPGRYAHNSWHPQIGWTQFKDTAPTIAMPVWCIPL